MSCPAVPLFINHYIYRSFRESIVFLYISTTREPSAHDHIISHSRTEPVYYIRYSEMSDVDSLFEEREQASQPRSNPETPKQHGEAVPRPSPSASEIAREVFADLDDIVSFPEVSRVNSIASLSFSELERALPLDPNDLQLLELIPPTDATFDEGAQEQTASSYPDLPVHKPMPYRYDQHFEDLFPVNDPIDDYIYGLPFEAGSEFLLPYVFQPALLDNSLASQVNPNFLLHENQGILQSAPEEYAGPRRSNEQAAVAFSPTPTNRGRDSVGDDTDDSEFSVVRGRSRNPRTGKTDHKGAKSGGATASDHTENVRKRKSDGEESASGSPERPTKRQQGNKTWIKLHQSQGRNRRTQNYLTFNPERVYSPLPKTPASWASFSYTPEGELEAHRFYSVNKIQQYLTQHPLHQYRGTGESNSADGPTPSLILWIQRNPADSARRYPYPSSNRCRFDKCFATHNCINQGQYRVALDEQGWKEANHDPQHNAGYVHLYCLEKFFDFPKLCRELDVRVEDRRLPHEPTSTNRMMMSTSHEVKVTAEFIQMCKYNNGVPEGYPHHNLKDRPYEGTLTHRLALAKVEAQPYHLKLRQDRRTGGSTVPGHLGNLELETQERDKTRLARNQRRTYRVDKNTRSPSPSRSRGSTSPRTRGRIVEERNVGTNPRRQSPSTRKPGEATARRSSPRRAAPRDIGADGYFRQLR